MLRRLVIGGIDFYRKGISPLTPPSCRYSPTCSAYAREAVERFGVARGGWLFLRRFARCNPLGGFGFDPVPPAGGSGGNVTSDPVPTPPPCGDPHEGIPPEVHLR